MSLKISLFLNGFDLLYLQTKQYLRDTSQKVYVITICAISNKSMLKIINKHNEGETLISILKDFYTFCVDKVYNTSFLLQTNSTNFVEDKWEINEIFSTSNESWACFFESVYLRYLCVTIDLFCIASP